MYTLFDANKSRKEKKNGNLIKKNYWNAVGPLWIPSPKKQNKYFLQNKTKICFKTAEHRLSSWKLILLQFIVFSRSLFELLLSECSGYCDEDNHQDDDAIAGKIELNLDFQLVVEALSKSRRIHRFRYNSFTDGIFCLFVVDSICFGGLFYIYLNISLFISIFIANK